MELIPCPLLLQREGVDEYKNPVIKDLLTFYILTEKLILSIT
jgi:hypothetical protein